MKKVRDMKKIHLRDLKGYRASDGTYWGVDVQVPGYSSAIVVFHHPDGRTARKDRYATLNWPGTEASQVTVTLDRATVQALLTDAVIARLFNQSVLIGGGFPAFSPA